MSGPTRDTVIAAIRLLQSELGAEVIAEEELLPPDRPDLAAASAMWHALIIALRELDLRAYHVTVYPDRFVGGEQPEANVYLITDDLADLRRLASYFGLTEPLEEREEIKEATGTGTPRRLVRYGVIERDRYHPDGPGLRVWASISVPLDDDGAGTDQ